MCGYFGQSSLLISAHRAQFDGVMQRNHRSKLTGDSLSAQRQKTAKKEKNIDPSRSYRLQFNCVTPSHAQVGTIDLNGRARSPKCARVH